MGFKSDKQRGKCPGCKISLDLENGVMPYHVTKVKVNNKEERVKCSGVGKKPN